MPEQTNKGWFLFDFCVVSQRRASRWRHSGLGQTQRQLVWWAFMWTVISFCRAHIENTFNLHSTCSFNDVSFILCFSQKVHAAKHDLRKLGSLWRGSVPSRIVSEDVCFYLFVWPGVKLDLFICLFSHSVRRQNWFIVLLTSRWPTTNYRRRWESSSW